MKSFKQFLAEGGNIIVKAKDLKKGMVINSYHDAVDDYLQGVVVGVGVRPDGSVDVSLDSAPNDPITFLATNDITVEQPRPAKRMQEADETATVIPVNADKDSVWADNNYVVVAPSLAGTVQIWQRKDNKMFAELKELNPAAIKQMLRQSIK